MQYIIIDFEFNNFSDVNNHCANLNEADTAILNQKGDCPNEIIEIGAVKLSQQMKTIDTLKIYIKPTIFSFINSKIKEITGITEEDLCSGVHFIEALKQLRSFIGDESIVCSWAKDDIVELIRNAEYHGCDNIPWISSYLDIQEYCTKILGLKSSLSLKNALQRFSIKFDESKLHDGLNDSLYTAEVLRRSYNHRAVKSFIIRDVKHMPAVTLKIDGGLKIREDFIELCCPKCKREVTIEYPLKAMKWRFVGVGYCEKCKINVMKEVIIKKNLVGEEIYKNSNRILNDEEYQTIIGRLRKIS